MRKPLVALSLAAVASLGAISAADTLAAPTASSPHGTKSSSSSTAQLSPAPLSRTQATSNTVTGAQIVRTALRYLGYPYTATGNSPATGFSCIGFVSFVYRSNGIPLPGDLADAMAFAPQVPFADLQPGDILFFQNTIWNGLSHTAIYLGGGRFVHAEYFGYGVRISSFNNDPKDGNYWIGKYLGANRPWGGAAVAPVIGAAPSTPPSGSEAQTPGVSTQQVVAGGHPAVVTAPSLNVRSAPSRTGAVQTVIARGTSVTIIGNSGAWAHVQLSNGAEGWVMRVYISRGVTSASTPAVSAQVNPNIGTPSSPRRANAPAEIKSQATTRVATTEMRVTGVRIHTSPAVSAPVITTTYAGQRMQVIARSNGWVEVRLPTGQTGWLVASYISGSSSSPRVSTSAKVTARTAAPVSTAKMQVTGVRIHTSPSVGAPVITTTYAGQRLQVVARSNGWMEVRLSTGQTGWLVASYAAGGSNSSATGASSSTKSSARASTSKGVSGGSVLTAGVRVHVAPGLNARVARVAPAGTHVQVLGSSGGWTLVRLPNGQTGYVASAYVH